MVGNSGNLSVTVVSGLPRSGTSLMMQMLLAGGMPLLTDGVRPPDVDNPRGYFEFEPVKRTRNDPGWVADAVGKAVKVVHLLLAELPVGFHYKVIFMQRNLDEVLKSQAAMLRRFDRPGAELSPERLAAVFALQVERARRRLSERRNFTMLDVDYGQLISEPGAQARRVNAFVAGNLDESKTATVPTASLYRHRA
jgi:hypothetical protein